MVRAQASKLFQPFFSSGDQKMNIEELQRKLMVDFDPSRCLIEDLEVDTNVLLTFRLLLNLPTVFLK